METGLRYNFYFVRVDSGMSVIFLAGSSEVQLLIYF